MLGPSFVLLAAGSWKPAAGSWKLEAGSWQLEAGSRQLATGSWRLAALELDLFQIRDLGLDGDRRFAQTGDFLIGQWHFVDLGHSTSSELC